MSSDETSPLVSENYPTASDNMSNSAETSTCGSACGMIAVIIFIVVASLQTSFIVEPGNIGLVVTLGQVTSYESGLHYKMPYLSRVITLSAKTQKLEESNTTPTKEGLSVKLDTAILYRIDPTKAADLYKDVGEYYSDVVLAPEAASAIRGLTSESDAKALYTSGRNLIQDSVKSELITKLTPRGIIIDDVLLKDLVLPQQLTAAIEAKVKAEQDAAKMQFVLQKEKQEAERKAIEAGGIASFQKIVSEGISENLLKWKGVEATEKFAESPNTKIVIMGNDANGLPVILNADGDSSNN